MDLTEQYIKMSNKAFEIQKLYGKYSSINDYFGYKIKPDVIYPEYCENKEYYFSKIMNFKLDNNIWLPKQDQLQKIVSEKNKIGNLLRNVNYCTYKISDFLEESGKKGELYFSMEQLWLAFVMKEKYNKTWNGEDWGLLNDT